jgi:hypothetical protein
VYLCSFPVEYLVKSSDLELLPGFSGILLNSGLSGAVISLDYQVDGHVPPKKLAGTCLVLNVARLY